MAYKQKKLMFWQGRLKLKRTRSKRDSMKKKSENKQSILKRVYNSLLSTLVVFASLRHWLTRIGAQLSRYKKVLSIDQVTLKWLMTGVSAIALSYPIYDYMKYREITWEDFTRLESKSIEKLEVVNGEWVRVVRTAENDDGKISWLGIAGADAFEEKLEDIQPAWFGWAGGDLRDKPPVIHKKESNACSIFLMIHVAMMYGLMLLKGPLSGLLDITSSLARIVKPADIDVRFRDVAGCEEAKMEIIEFVNFLKNPRRYKDLGARIPKGALLTGPPGIGKTLMAKAAAGEAACTFISVSGSEFNEMYVGVGSSRVRDMFETARKLAPSILFIDEIDAIGRERSETSYSSEDNTLNQLLKEMDGFDTKSNVVVLAATNRVDVLDEALLRPGRFDRKIRMSAPDIKGRSEIFKVHLEPIATDLNKGKLSQKLAASTPGFTGADIKNVCNEAALIAARYSDSSVVMKHFEQAIDRVVAGIERKTNVLSPQEKKIIAYHEAGHAVSSWLVEADVFVKVTIIPRGTGLGYSQYIPEELALYNEKQLFDRMCVALGGRASEKIFFGEITTGAQDDLQKVTKLAHDQVVKFGMSPKIGNISLDPDEHEYSESTAELIDSEVKSLIDKAYERTIELLEANRSNVEAVAKQLIDKETLDREDMIELLGARPFKEKLTYEDFLEGTSAK